MQDWAPTQECYIGCLRVKKGAVVQQAIERVHGPSRVRHQRDMVDVEAL